jgi:hypothetical protein
MQRAGILEGLPDTVDLSRFWELITVADDKRLKEFEGKFNAKLTAKFKHVPDSFARMLAKIAYGQILTSLDPSDFRAICLPYILGQKPNPSFIVGGQYTDSPPDSGIGYRLNSMAFRDRQTIVLVAEVRLLSNAHTPIYHVIVGDVSGEARVARVLDKLGPGEFAEYGKMLPAKTKSKHWLSSIWPLPHWS